MLQLFRVFVFNIDKSLTKYSHFSVKQSLRLMTQTDRASHSHSHRDTDDDDDDDDEGLPVNLRDLTPVYFRNIEKFRDQRLLID